jgi:hypothetical protein
LIGVLVMQLLVRIGLLVLTGLVAISATAGGIWVVPTMPMDWIKAGPFTDWTIPAIALTLVGLFHAAVFVALLARPWLGALGAFAGGVAMVVFEIVEVGVVGWTLTDPELAGYFQAWLQLIFLVVGSAQALLAVGLWAQTRRTAPPIPVIHPSTA